MGQKLFLLGLVFLLGVALVNAQENMYFLIDTEQQVVVNGTGVYDYFTGEEILPKPVSVFVSRDGGKTKVLAILIDDTQVIGLDSTVQRVKDLEDENLRLNILVNGLYKEIDLLKNLLKDNGTTTSLTGFTTETTTSIELSKPSFLTRILNFFKNLF